MPHLKLNCTQWKQWTKEPKTHTGLLNNGCTGPIALNPTHTDLNSEFNPKTTGSLILFCVTETLHNTWPMAFFQKRGKDFLSWRDREHNTLVFFFYLCFSTLIGFFVFLFFCNNAHQKRSAHFNSASLLYLQGINILALFFGGREKMKGGKNLSGCSCL